MHLVTLTKRLRTDFWRLSLLVLSLTLGYTGAATATLWNDGDVITYHQNDWGNSASAAGILLLANYDAVYAPFSVVEVGIPGAAGFSIQLSIADAVIDYLPAIGAIGSLTHDAFNSISTDSGDFGGQVLALQLNVDFSDAGVTLGALGVPYGDLTLFGFAAPFPDFNGLTVRQFLAIENTLLGGGSAIYSIDDVSTVYDGLNTSFRDGTVSQFARDHLSAPVVTHEVPEPGTLALFGVSLLGLAFSRRKQ